MLDPGICYKTVRLGAGRASRAPMRREKAGADLCGSSKPAGLFSAISSAPPLSSPLGRTTDTGSNPPDDLNVLPKLLCWLYSTLSKWRSIEEGKKPPYLPKDFNLCCVSI